MLPGADGGPPGARPTSGSSSLAGLLDAVRNPSSQVQASSLAREDPQVGVASLVAGARAVRPLPSGARVLGPEGAAAAGSGLGPWRPPRRGRARDHRRHLARVAPSEHHDLLGDGSPRARRRARIRRTGRPGPGPATRPRRSPGWWPAPARSPRWRRRDPPSSRSGILGADLQDGDGLLVRLRDRACRCATRRVVTCAKSPGRVGAGGPERLLHEGFALASMSIPVRHTFMSLRKPPGRLMHTFSVAGGGSPWMPCMRTRSRPT